MLSMVSNKNNNFMRRILGLESQSYQFTHLRCDIVTLSSAHPSDAKDEGPETIQFGAVVK